MNEWAFFALAFGISLMGSLPFGMINLNVLATAVHRGPRPALVMGLGATMVEAAQLVLVLFGFDYLASHTSVDQVLQWIAIPVFLGLAIHYWRSRPSSQHGEVVRSRPFLRGVGLGVINVLIYPFWFLWLGIIQFPVDDHALWPWFIIGAFLGAFASMVIFTVLGRVIEQRSEALTRHLHRIIAVMFLGLGLWQILRLTFL
ncbi:MAG: LysE family transporter [Saprospiraceae bacterium]